jgi:hypothetical protein
LKGHIYPAGFRAFEYTDQEISDIGDKGIKLVPWNPRHRTWWLRISDDYQRKEWLNALAIACFRSLPAHDDDECIASAFNLTLRNLRQFYSFWGYYSECGNEIERLSDFLLDLLDHQILIDYYNTFPDNSRRLTIEQTIQKSITSKVMEMCTSTWNTLHTSMKENSSKLQADTKSLIHHILEKEIEYKSLIHEKIQHILEPFLITKGNNIIKPILLCIAKPMMSAFFKSVTLFHNFLKDDFPQILLELQQIQQEQEEERRRKNRRSFAFRATEEVVMRGSSSEKIQNNNNDNEKKNQQNGNNSNNRKSKRKSHKHNDPHEISQLSNLSGIAGNEETSQYTLLLSILYAKIFSYHGPFQDSYEILYALYMNDLNMILSLLSGGVTSYLIYQMMNDQLRMVLFKAMFTFSVYLKEITNDNELPSVMHHVLSLLLHDIQITIKSALLMILKTIMSPLLQEYIIIPSQKILDRIQEKSVDRTLLLPGLAIFISLPNLLNKNLDEKMDHYLLVLIENTCKEQLKLLLDKYSREIGISIEGDNAIGIGTWRQFSDDNSSVVSDRENYYF